MAKTRRGMGHGAGEARGNLGHRPRLGSRRALVGNTPRARRRGGAAAVWEAAWGGRGPGGGRSRRRAASCALSPIGDFDGRGSALWKARRRAEEACETGCDVMCRMRVCPKREGRLAMKERRRLGQRGWGSGRALCRAAEQPSQQRQQQGGRRRPGGELTLGDGRPRRGSLEGACRGARPALGPGVQTPTKEDAMASAGGTGRDRRDSEYLVLAAAARAVSGTGHRMADVSERPRSAIGLWPGRGVVCSSLIGVEGGQIVSRRFDGAKQRPGASGGFAPRAGGGRAAKARGPRSRKRARRPSLSGRGSRGEWSDGGGRALGPQSLAGCQSSGPARGPLSSDCRRQPATRETEPQSPGGTDRQGSVAAKGGSRGRGLRCGTRPEGG